MFVGRKTAKSAGSDVCRWWRSYTVVSVQHCSSGMCDTVICDGDCWWVWRRSLYWWVCCLVCCHWRCRMSALHQAALIGNIDIMRLLLEHGAVVDIADSKSKSPVTHGQQKLVSSTSYHSPSSLLPSFPLQHSFIFTFSNTFVLLQYYVTIFHSSARWFGWSLLVNSILIQFTYRKFVSAIRWRIDDVQEMASSLTKYWYTALHVKERSLLRWPYNQVACCSHSCELSDILVC